MNPVRSKKSEISADLPEVNRTSNRMKATVVGLQGELGSGKTHFVKMLGEMMGIEEHITSPTFIIMKVYPMDWRGYKKLIHIDAYRIEKESELLHLGWQDLIKKPENLILIEWPERVEGILPKDTRIISFKHHV